MFAKMLARSACRFIMQKPLLRVLSHSSACNMTSSTSETSKHYNQVDAEAFVKELSDLILKRGLPVGTTRQEKVLNFTHPKHLQKIINFDIAHDGATKEEMMNLCESVIDHSVKTGHPHFFNQLFSSHDAYSLGGAWLLEALHPNQHTYECSPVFILVERYMLEKINSYVGFQHFDGVFLPGGSLGNMMPMHLARYRHNKDMKTKGHLGSPQMVIFVSEDAHYSTKKGAHFMGFGTDNLIAVKADARGRMDPTDLEAKVQATKDQGRVPLYVCATAGTTVLGSFDPISQIADVCEKHDIWLHVDGAWGGAVLLSDKHRHLMDGLQRADSFLWNFHKMLHTSLQCSAFLVNHPKLLEEANALGATYLFQPDKGYDTSYDIGDKTIQGGRKPDAFKLWVQWKARGDSGLAWTVDHAYENARYLTERIRKSDAFRLVIREFDYTNICFWYIPPSMRSQPETDDWWQQLHKVTAEIKRRMMAAGTMMIGYQPLVNHGLVNFWRIIISNPDLTTADMDFVLDEIDRLASDL